MCLQNKVYYYYIVYTIKSCMIGCVQVKGHIIFFISPVNLENISIASISAKFYSQFNCNLLCVP